MDTILLIPPFYSALFGQLLSAVMAIEGYYESRKLFFPTILPSQKFGMHTEEPPNIITVGFPDRFLFIFFLIFKFFIYLSRKQ